MIVLVGGKEILRAVRDDLPQALQKKVAEKASKASANDPMNSYYHFVLAYSSNLLGDKESALGHYERALALNPVHAT